MIHPISPGETTRILRTEVRRYITAGMSYEAATMYVAATYDVARYKVCALVKRQDVRG